MAQRYPYKSLKGSRSLRLFELFPGEGTNSLQGRLRDATLNDNPTYEATSYVWGHESDPVSISCDGHEMKIGRNIAAALSHFRQGTRTRTLWIDTVCGNHAELPEKNMQGGMMIDIFHEASCVLVWLGIDGQDDEKSSSAYQGLKIILENLWDQREELAKYLRSYSEDTSRNTEQIERYFILPSADELSALKGLFERPWFGRAWTYQESHLAREKEFFFDSYQVNGHDFDHVLLILVHVFQFTNDSRFLSHPITFKAGLILTSDEKRFEKSKNGKAMYNFLTTMAGRRGSGCKDPHDLIYSVLGAVPDGPSIAIDYSQPWPETFAATTAQYILESGKLDIFGEIYSRAQPVILPSWVPDWRPDYVSLTRPHDRPHRCSGSSRAVACLSSSCREIDLEGYLWDSIHATNYGNTEKTMNWMQKKVMDLPDEQALSIDEQHEIDSLSLTPTFYEPTQQNAITCFLALGNLDIIPSMRWDRGDRQRISSPTSADERLLNNPEEFRQKMIEEMMLNMFTCKIAITKNRRLGLVPKSAKSGDVVAILMGGDVPILLRPDPSDGRYTFVGECYMHGFMVGQALVEARRHAWPDYTESDTTWLERLHETPSPFPPTTSTIK